MGANRKAQAFLGAGAWVPVDVAAQLRQQLVRLFLLMMTREPLDPDLSLLIKIELSNIKHLRFAGQERNSWVPAQRWQDAVRRIQLLAKSLD